jgi:hypothetical protein
VGTFTFIVYLFFHVMRTLRVLFIYKWYVCGLKRSLHCISLNRGAVRYEAIAYDVGSVEWFVRFQFVLRVRFYVKAGLILLVFVICPFILVTTFESPLYASSGSNIYSTTRCQWWHIPGGFATPAATPDVAYSCTCNRAVYS